MSQHLEQLHAHKGHGRSGGHIALHEAVFVGEAKAELE